MFKRIEKLMATGGINLIPSCSPTSCSLDDFLSLIRNIIGALVYIAVPLATAIIIYGGVLLLTAAGSEERIKQGKTAIYTAVTGLAIVFGSYIIYSTVIKAIFIPNS